MGKSKELDLATRGSIKTLQDEGYSFRSIARRLNVPFATVRTTINRFNLIGSHKTLPRSGRPRATTARIDKIIVDMIDKSNEPNAISIADSLAKLDIAHISPSTVRRRLNEDGLHGRAPVKKPLLTKNHIKKRLAFGLKHQSWTIDDWKNVLFTDETKINKMGSDGKTWTWKRPNEPLQAKHVKQTVKHDASVMAWGCFSSSGVGNITVVEGHMNAPMYIRILSSHMIPSARRLFEETYIFQHDNDPKHTALAVKAYLEKKRIKVLDWPSQSPDLNPIENLWHKLKTLIHNEKVTKLSELPEVMKKCWESISPEYCNKLVESMPRKMDQLVSNKGLWIQY